MAESLAQLAMRTRSNKHAELRLQSHPMVAPLTHPLGPPHSVTFSLMARMQVKPMEWMPKIGGMGLALLSRSRQLTAR